MAVKMTTAVRAPLIAGGAFAEPPAEEAAERRPHRSGDDKVRAKPARDGNGKRLKAD